MQEQLHKDATAVILFDAAVAPQVDHRWFAPDYWCEQNALRTQSGGRGGVSIIATPAGECVLRHFRRGGLIAALMGDRYLWTGAATTRSFAELRLLAAILERGLPAPRPVAARYVRHGLFYTGDLITQRIGHAHTLAECLQAGRLDAAVAARVGALVARFHRAGVWHADLNAHNILVDDSLVDDGGLHLIDFDRSRLRRPATSWQQANLRRLRRSLVKLGAAAAGEEAFTQTLWQPLIHQYERTLSA